MSPLFTNAAVAIVATSLCIVGTDADHDFYNHEDEDGFPGLPMVVGSQLTQPPMPSTDTAGTLPPTQSSFGLDFGMLGEGSNSEVVTPSPPPVHLGASPISAPAPPTNVALATRLAAAGISNGGSCEDASIETESECQNKCSAVVRTSDYSYTWWTDPLMQEMGCECNIARTCTTINSDASGVEQRNSSCTGGNTVTLCDSGSSATYPILIALVVVAGIAVLVYYCLVKCLVAKAGVVIDGMFQQTPQDSSSPAPTTPQASNPELEIERESVV